MTFREKLAQEHPECIDNRLVSGCTGCPSNYGYEPDYECGGLSCWECWNREMPLTPEEQEKHDLEINEEIIQGYCDQYTSKQCSECPAEIVCDQVYADGTSWHCWPDQIASHTKQRSMLDAFEAALPPEEDMPYPVRRRIPESVRDLIDSRIISIDNQIKFLQAERQELVDFWNGKDMEK